MLFFEFKLPLRQSDRGNWQQWDDTATVRAKECSANVMVAFEINGSAAAPSFFLTEYVSDLKQKGSLSGETIR